MRHVDLLYSGLILTALMLSLWTGALVAAACCFFFTPALRSRLAGRWLLLRGRLARIAWLFLFS